MSAYVVCLLRFDVCSVFVSDVLTGVVVLCVSVVCECKCVCM